MSHNESRPHIIGLRDLASQNNRSIKAAGPRYMPGVDPSAPNIEIDHLVEALDALSLSDGFRERIGKYQEDIKEAARRSLGLDRLFQRNRYTLQRIYQDVLELCALRSASEIGEQQKKTIRTCKIVTATLRNKVDRLNATRNQNRDSRAVSEQQRELDSKIYDLRLLISAIVNLQEYLTAATGKLLSQKNCTMILGPWGTGKTHFLCDIARVLTKKKEPALLIMANSLKPNINPLEAIAEKFNSVSGASQLLQELNDLGADCGRRALLLIDAINEGDRDVWRRDLRKLVHQIKAYPNIGIVLTCRTPFEKTMVPESLLKMIVGIEHFGFEEQEFDAQIEYFVYYRIPAPHMPLLTPEFSRPLFLKMLCEAISGLSSRSKKAKLKEIAEGQKGMTYVLEYFAKKLGKDIESDFKLSNGSCWRLLKGDSASLGYAGVMAEAVKEWLSVTEAQSIAEESLELNKGQAQALIRRLVTDGLLTEGVIWHEESWVEVVQFPYQRFGDHLVARHILDKHLDTRSESSVKRSFYANKKLGQVFKLDRWGQEFQYPGLATAIMLEFPERMKRTGFERECVYYIPKKRKLVAPIKDVFLEGLYWRAADSFTQETDRLVSFFLNYPNEYIRNDTIEILVGLASRPRHPYCASRLLKYLMSLAVKDRELTWSEFLRQADVHSAVFRLLTWIEKNRNVIETDDVASNQIRLLSCLLTTTRRPLRDRATRALVLIGLRKSRLLFEETLSSLDFNDPYVPERMLAASYGVAMRLWADPDGGTLRQTIPAFAESLLKEMFMPGAAHSTKHILARDYALGICELARKINLRTITSKESTYLKPGFPQIESPFEKFDDVSEEDLSDVKQALRMDFENYTIGRLIPNRRNYDHENRDHQKVRRQILQRMQELGYSTRVFGSIDKSIEESNWRIRRYEDGEKTDRYGKKYSWIAFFEMYGVRLDEGRLDNSRSVERTSSCDIDPSFPENPPMWFPMLPDTFKASPKKHAEWLAHGLIPDYKDLLERSIVDSMKRGPWVLLDGRIYESGTNNRKISGYIDAVFVKRENVEAYKSQFLNGEYVGNQVHTPGEDYYTYAGEIPWSRHFAPEVRHKNGTAMECIDRVYRFSHGIWNGVPVEIPVHYWVWEGYHSTMNQVSGVTFPAPAICEDLSLVNHDGSFDLFDSAGRRATIFRRHKSEKELFGSDWLYLRKDLLLEYLNRTDQQMLWLIWGERTLDVEHFKRERPPDVQEILHERTNTFGYIIEWGSRSAQAGRRL